MRHPSHFSLCPWVIHRSSLASLFPILFLTSPCLSCTYHLCFLFPVPFPPFSPLSLPTDSPPCDAHFCDSVLVLVVCLVCFCFFKIFYLFIFRERRREGERQGKKHHCVVASHVPLTGDLAWKPGMCPDWDSNWQCFGWQTCAQSTELYQPGLVCFCFSF